MILEAHSLGLASRWIGAFDVDQVKSLLKIPDEAEPQIILAVGHPKDVPPKPPKYPLEALVYFGWWRMKILDPAKYLDDIAGILARKAHAATEMVGKGKGFVAEKVKSVVKKE